MSLKAMIWVMEDAPVGSHAELAVLYALADRASDDGTAAWPSQEWIADRARCSDRTVRRVLSLLESAGVIRRGDQSLVEKFPGNRRPVVWDLNLSLTQENQAGQNDHPKDPDSPQAGHGCPAGQDARGDIHDTQGGHSRQLGRTLVSDKPSLTIHEPPRGVTEVGNVTKVDASTLLPPSSDSPDPAGVPPTWIADPRRARCRVHAGIDSPPPCRDCASAREAAEAVRRDRDAARQSDANHRREAIDACGLCDHNGLVPVDGAGRVGRCPHDADELAAIQDRATAEDADRSSREKSVAAHVAPTRRRWQQESAKRKQRRAAEAAAKAKAEREAAEAAERETAAESGTDPDDAPDDIPDTETR